MPYRSRPDVWFNLPGVVAAYQPIAAPDPFAARQNVAHSGARFGVYTATPGTAPTWNAATGWKFDGATQYLLTGWDAGSSNKRSAFARFSNGDTNKNNLRFLFGGQSTRDFGIAYPWNGWTHHYCNSETANFQGTLYTQGVIGFGGLVTYWNGIQNNTLANSNIATNTVAIGANQTAVTVNGFYLGNIKAIIFCNTVLAPSQAIVVSTQMAYCDINPDWSAWARRRRYYYAPSQAGFQAAWDARQNRLIGGGLN